MVLAEFVESDGSHRKKKGIKLIEEIKQGCSNCNMELATIIRVKESEMTQKYQFVCPRCGDKTFIKTIKGETYLGSAAENLIISDIFTDQDKQGIFTHLVEIKYVSR